VLGGVKRAFASLTGCAALDPACARCALASIDGSELTFEASAFKQLGLSDGERAAAALTAVIALCPHAAETGEGDWGRTRGWLVAARASKASRLTASRELLSLESQSRGSVWRSIPLSPSATSRSQSLRSAESMAAATACGLSSPPKP
jgi:hypothetical protein